MTDRRRQRRRWARHSGGRAPLARPRAAASLLPVLLPLLLALALLLMMIHESDASYSVLIPSGSERCFGIKTPKGGRATVSGNFDLLDDGMSPDPVSATLYDSKMRPAYSSRLGKSEDTFSVPAVGGHKYQLCLGNGYRERKDRDGMDRTIGFSLRVRSGGKAVDDKEDEKDKSEAEKRAAALQDLAGDLMERFETMMDHQAYLRDREASHRELAESTFGLVFRWTLLEALILIMVALGNIMYLRQFIEKRRYL